MVWLWLGIALVVGFGTGWVLSRNRSTAEMARFEGRIEELQGRLVRAQRANEALLAQVGDGRDRSDGATDVPMDRALGRPEDGRAGRQLADALYDRADEVPDHGRDSDVDEYGEADDLTRIHGIGAVLQDKLYDLGITSYRQVAALTPEESASLDRTLQLRGRIERDDWVGQASRLSAQ